MRALLTGGIKAILAVAALSTAAHWTLRVQREAATPLAAASPPDPIATGSIEPRRAERPVGVASAASPVAAAMTGPATGASLAGGLDQSHLAALIAGTTPAKPKVVKTATKTAAAEKVAAKR
jgi:hypothetical protein